MRKRLILFLIILPLMAFQLSGCASGEIKAEAELVAVKYFKLIKKRDINRAISLYSSDFVGQKTPADWFRGLSGLHSSLGIMKDYSLKESKYKKTNDYGGGTIVTLNYIVRYRKESTKEKFQIFVPGKSSKTTAMITRHNIRVQD